METGVSEIKQDEINTDWSFENLNTSVSLEMAANGFYNVTPIESQINHIGENSRTQSSKTLTDGTIINNLISGSRCSVNVKVNDTEDNVTNSVYAPGFLKEIVENIYNNTLIDTPRILFNAPKAKYKKIRKNTLRPSNRKSHRMARLVTYYIRHYKYKHPEKIIPTKFKTYYDKTRRNPANRSRIQQNLFAKLDVKAISRSTILKKVLAKENLLNDIYTVKSSDIQQGKVLEKDPSEDTLTKINSESSHNDSIHTKTPTSVVEIPRRKSVTQAASHRTITLTQNGTSDLSNQSHKTYYDNEFEKYHINNNTEESKNQNSFKTEIEVALALNDASISKYLKINCEQSREGMLYKENLTSAESFMSESDIFNITSSQEISGMHIQNVNVSKSDNDKICIVINDVVKTFNNNTSDSDTFVKTQTSSYSKNRSDSVDMSSDQTLTYLSELTNQTSPCNIYFQPTRKAEAKSALLDTNETIFPKPDRCSSNSLGTDNYLTNDIIITDELRRVPLAIRELTADKNIRNVMQKSFSVDNDGDRPKNINLPNEDTIRSILEAEVEKKSCSEEFRYFIPQADVLEKLISFLDTAIRRMEDSLLKRIGNEVKSTLDKFEKFLPVKEEHDFVKSNIKFESTDENKSDLSRLESDDLSVLQESVHVQCGLVKNEIIDELTKMTIEGERNAKCPVQITETKVMIKNEDSFKVLKPVELCTSVGEQGDSHITSLSEDVRVERLSKKSSLLSYLAVPIRFVKTNILVLTSVPAFFVSIFLLYSFFMLLV